MRMATIITLGLIGLTAGCAGISSLASDPSVTDPFGTRAVPPGPPPPPPALMPAHAPAGSAAEVALGQALFFEKALSKGGSISCASCHDPAKGFSNGLPVATGVGGAHGTRNSPTIWGAAAQPLQFWDGRASSLEEQALGPIQNPLEMANTLPAMTQTLQNTPAYARQFQAVYGRAVAPDLVARAIATYERTKQFPANDLSTQLLRGDAAALAQLNPTERQGANLFRSANCVACHGGPDGRDNRFHNLGICTNVPSPDTGRFGVTGQAADWGAFKTPTLRNVADTAPYMHDGSLATLRDVVDHYSKGGIPNRNLDARLRPLNLTETQKQALVAFLSRLHGPNP